MLVALEEILTKTKQKNYIVLAYNIGNEHNLHATIETAERVNIGIIPNTTPVANPGLGGFGQIVVDLTRRSRVKTALNLDHDRTLEGCLSSTRTGYTFIMIGQSLLPSEENVREVQEMVRARHALGISVEVKPGHISVGEQYHADGRQAFTRAEEVMEYVKQTEVDTLAVVIGIVYGVYKGTPQIHFDLPHELKGALDIPLVLYGGNGTGDENPTRYAREGINKISLSNDLKRSVTENLVREDLSGDIAYQPYPLSAEGFKHKIKHCICLFGYEGK